MPFSGNLTSARPAVAAWPRRALASLWVLLLAVLASSVASTWEGLMARLAGAPAPVGPVSTAPSSLSAATPGERAITEARRLGERGDLAGALAALERVTPLDPAYPFARQLHGQAAEALRNGGRWR